MNDHPIPGDPCVRGVLARLLFELDEPAYGWKFELVES
jgi:hypothetical protein